MAGTPPPPAAGLPAWWDGIDYRPGHAELAGASCACGATVTFRRPAVHGDPAHPHGLLPLRCDATGKAVDRFRSGPAPVRPTGRPCS